MAMSRAGRKRLIVVMGIVVLGAGLAGAAWLKQVRLENNMQTWLTEGTAAYERRDYEQALGLLNQYVSRDKTNVDALLDFADCRRQIPLANQEHLAQAQHIVQSALTFEPESHRGWVMLMEIYSAYTPPRFTEARSAAERVNEIAESQGLPPDPVAHETRIKALLATNQPEGARTAAMELAEAIPDDLSVQSSVFHFLHDAEAQPPVLEAFIAEREDRFAGRLGLELMRVRLLLRGFSGVAAGSDEAETLQQELHAAFDRAMDAPAESAEEVVRLVNYLEALDDRNRPLAEEVLDRYLSDPAFGQELVAFAASRSWARGERTEAGHLVLESVPDLADASDELLGWLALSGLPEADEAIQRLEGRDSDEAAQWRALAAAHTRLVGPNPVGAAELLPTRMARGGSLELVHLYLRGWSYRIGGEPARAAEEWRRLLELGPRWAIARRELAGAYTELGRPLDARAVLLADRATVGTDQHFLVELLIDEQGLTRPDAMPGSYLLLSSAREADPLRVDLAAWAARAAIATGRTGEASEIIDGLLGSDLAEAPREVLVLADQLSAEDPTRAAALREAVSRVASSPETVYRLAAADFIAGDAARGRERIEQHLETADDAIRHEWDATLAMYLDLIGDPGAADALLALSARYPDRLEAQLATLQSDSAWIDPEPLGAVIDRLQKITGDTSTLARVYRNKRIIAMIDPDASDVRERANGVLLDLSTIANQDQTNADAAETMSRAARLVGDHRRAAEFLGRAVRADSNNLRLRLEWINTALPRAGRLEEARAEAAVLPSLPLRSNAHRRARATTLERFGLSAEAQADWDHLARAGDSEAAVRRARALDRQGQRAQAEALIERVAADPDPTDAARLAAAQFLAARGRFDEGLALAEGGPAQVLGRFLVTTTVSAADARRAEQIARNRDRADLWAAAVLCFLTLDNFDHASSLLAEAAAAHPDAPELARFARVLAAVDEGAADTRLLVMRALIGDTDDPSTDPVAARVATLIDAYEAGRTDAAGLASAIADGLDQGRRSIIAWSALAAAHEAAGDLDAVVRTYRDAMQALPGSAAIAREAHIRLDSLQRVEESFQAARAWRERLDGPHYEADRAYAVMLAKRGLYRDALAALQPWRQQMLEGDDRPGAQGDAAFFAILLAENGEGQAAVEIVRPQLDAAEDGLAHGVRLSFSLKDNSLRRAWLDELMPRVLETASAELAGQIAASWQDWAIAAGGSPAQVRAATEAAESLMASPWGVRIPVVRLAALGRDGLGDAEAAERHYRTALELDDSLYNMHNNLAMLLIGRGQGSEAVSHAQRAVDLARAAGAPPAELGNLLDTLAKAHEAAGQPAEAAATRSEAAALSDR